METTFEKLTPTSATLKIVVAEEDYKQGLDKKIKQYSRTANIKGFRAGHVPAGYIKKLYGKSLLVDEVINTVSGQVNTYIKENNLQVVGDPMPKEDAYKIDWDTDKEFTFEYEVGLASDFEVAIDALPAITAYEIQPTDERINEAIEDLRKRFGGDTDVEEAEIGDILFGKLTQTESGYESQSGIPTDRVLESAQTIFKGLEVGSSITFDIQSIFEDTRSLGFATGKSDEDAAAMQGIFEFVVERIARSAPAELNQELFDKAFGPGVVNSEEELRAEVIKVMSENYARESAFLLDFQTEKALVSNIKIDLPDEYLKRWLLQVNEGKFTEEQIEADYEAFARGLRLDLIRNEIAAKNADAIKVEYDDVLESVKDEIKGYFGGQGFQGMEDFIDQMARKQLNENKNENFRKYFNTAFSKKVIAFVKDSIKKESKTISVDEFNEVAKAIYA